MSSGIFSDGLFSIYATNAHNKYKILSIVEKVDITDLSKEKIIQILKIEKIDVEVTINEEPENNWIQYHIAQLPDICEQCKKRAVAWSKYCGANVCGACGKHQGLAKCYCSWNLQTGEKLPDDIGEGAFDGATWEVEY